MSALANVAHMKAQARPRTVDRLRREPDRIPQALAWQPRAALGIAEVAKISQLFRRRNFAFMFRCGTVARPSASHGKAMGVQPGSIL